MKKLALVLSLLVFSLYAKAQDKKTHTDPSGKVWQNAVLRADGVTELDGVEAFCDKTTCNGEDVVFIKFINNNDYKVRIEWQDAIRVNGVWYYSKTTSKIFYLDAKSTTTGQCDGEPKLKVNVASIIDNPKKFQYFTLSGLAINK